MDVYLNKKIKNDSRIKEDLRYFIPTRENVVVPKLKSRRKRCKLFNI
jgi:hypothetical protein